MPIDRWCGQKINMDTQALNRTVDQMAIIDDVRILHPEKAEYIFFSSSHGTFSKTDYILGYKSSISKFKKIEIIWSIFSDQNTMRLDINYRGKRTVEKQTHGG